MSRNSDTARQPCSEALDAEPSEIICVIDDDPLQCGAACRMLARKGFSVRSFLSAADFLNASLSLSAGAIVADVYMPALTGLDLLAKLREKGATTPVILMTDDADVRLAIRTLKSGAADFLEKPFSEQELTSAVQNALRQSRQAAAQDWLVFDARRRLQRLSDRERDILALLAEGQANKVIARNLNLSPRTVEAHRAAIMRKTQVDSFPALIKLNFLATQLP